MLEELDKLTTSKEDAFLRLLKRNYRDTQKAVEKELAVFIGKYGVDGKFSAVEMAKYNRLDNMLKQIDAELRTLNAIKRSEIPKYLDEVYQFNYYRTAFTLETEAQKKLAYGLINKGAIAESTARELLMLSLQDNANQLLLKAQRDITLGIAQGLSIKDMSKAVTERLNIDGKTATQIVRTSTTSVMNKARQDSLKHAEDRGLELKKFWIATLDNRTRDRHRELDGQTRDTEKPFSNGLMYPGDPSGPPEEVYNCRCGLGTDIGLERGERRAGSDVIPYTTYDEWFKNRVVNSN
jgi:SPP1 gp7 family putative phage head morphogenesis protein